LTNFLPELGGSDESSGEQSVVEEPDTQQEAEVPETPSIVEVPDLYWASEAAGLLDNAGLVLGSRNDVPNVAFPAGVVVETEPLEGTGVEQGTQVNIFVSIGPEPVPVVQQPVPASAPVPAPAVNEKPEKPDKPKNEKKQKGEEKKGKNDKKERGSVDEDGEEEED